MRSFISAAAVVLSLALLPATTHAQSAQPTAAAQASSGLVVKPGAWGKLKLGMTHVQAQKTGMVSKKPSGCAPGYQMATKYFQRGHVVWKGDFPKMKVDLIAITGAKDHTQRKIHVGSTLRQLRKAYPRLTKVYRSSEITGAAASSDEMYVAFIGKPGVGVVGFQFGYGTKPKASSKIAMIVLSRKRTVYWGC